MKNRQKKQPPNEHKYLANLVVASAGFIARRWWDARSENGIKNPVAFVVELGDPLGAAIANLFGIDGTTNTSDIGSLCSSFIVDRESAVEICRKVMLDEIYAGRIESGPKLGQFEVIGAAKGCTAFTYLPVRHPPLRAFRDNQITPWGIVQLPADSDKQ